MYAVKADLTPRRVSQQDLIELTDDVNAGAMDDACINDILTESSGTVDSYCRLRYATPLQASEQVKGLCLDLAEYKLFSRRRRIPESVKDNYDNAIGFLKDVAAGRAVLDQPVAAAAQVGGGPAYPTQKEEKFSDDNLRGFCS